MKDKIYKFIAKKLPKRIKMFAQFEDYSSLYVTEKEMRTFAKLMPEKLKYFVVIEAWTEATTGNYASTDATKITVDEMLRRIDK